VQASGRSDPDWRDPRDYAPLLDADRALFAWEWLRRDPLYRDAAWAALGEGRCAGATDRRARPFGLVAFEAPELGVPHARPAWRADSYPYVLCCGRRPLSKATDRFELAPLSDVAKIVRGAGAEHLLLCDGLHLIRLDGDPGLFTGGDACLGYTIAGLESAAGPTLALRRFLALCSTGHFARSLHRREVRARRWILMLRACDALASGADQREIAQLLFSPTVHRPGWRAREPSVRSQVQRLVRSARCFAAGGYRLLLR